MALNNQYSPGVHEIDLPKAQFSASNTCQGAITKFINRSLKSTSYLWRFGDSTTSKAYAIDHLYKNIGKYIVTLVVKGKFGYTDSIKRTIEIYETPKAVFNTNTINFCQRTAVAFNNTTAGNVTFLWTFDDSTTDIRINPTHVFKYAGNQTVKLKATSLLNCKDSVSATYTFFARPKADFNYKGNCAKSGVLFSSQSTGESFYKWLFDDSTFAVSKNISHSYQFAGNKQVKLAVTSSNFCSDTITKSVLINPLPVVNFVAYNHCYGDTMPLNNTSVCDSSYYWDLGDGSTSNLFIPKHIYSNISSYDITLTATNKNGCSNKLSQIVTVDALPSANFTYKHLNDSVYLMASDTNLQTYFWTVDQVPLNQNKKTLGHVFSTKGQHTIVLKATNSNLCSDTFSQVIDNTVGLHKIQNSNLDWCIYPNPFTNNFTLHFSNSKNRPIGMKIQNAMGQVLFEFEIEADQNSTFTYVWDADKFPLAAGIYQISIMIDDFRTTRSLIHQ
jgi:PKD repeat protein